MARMAAPDDSPGSGAAAPKAKGPATTPIVGIGASAGGLSAFQALFEAAPVRSGIAWVLIQHLAPDRESHLADILRQKTSLPISEVTKRTRVEPDHVYVIAPGTTLRVDDGSLVPTKSDRDTRRTPIDTFFLSLAEHRGERAGGAILSGAGTDGTLGLKAVKEAGGLTLAQ